MEQAKDVGVGDNTGKQGLEPNQNSKHNWIANLWDNKHNSNLFYSLGISQVNSMYRQPVQQNDFLQHS